MMTGTRLFLRWFSLFVPDNPGKDEAIFKILSTIFSAALKLRKNPIKIISLLWSIIKEIAVFDLFP